MPLLGRFLHFIDGQALRRRLSFGEYDDNNVWQPKEVSIISPNDGTNWASSAYLSSTSHYSTYVVGNGFDNDENSQWLESNQGGSVTLSNIFISYASSVEIKLGGTGATVSVNGGTGQSVGANSWVSVASGSGTLTSLSWQANGSEYPALYGIKIDGVLLVANAGTYGTNGFHLDFSDNSSNQALGYDAAVTAPTLNPRGGMDVITYTGNGSTQNITGLNFQSDLVWIKRRNGANAHALFDSIRGVTKVLESSNAGAEKTNDPAITSFDTNGFTVGGTYGQTNASSGTYVAWCWKAGGSAVSNSDGTITSQVSASTDYGFSVVTWTGQSSGSATVGHGLNAAPKWIIVKGRTGTVGWTVGHESLGWTKRLKLDTTDSASTSSNYWNDTAPTNSVFTSGANNVNNTFVAYCWSEVSRIFSKFGSYSRHWIIFR